MKPSTVKFHTVLILFIVFTSQAFAQKALVIAKGAGTVKNAIIVFKVDGEWGETFWAGTFMYNNRSNFKFKEELLPGTHVLELMYDMEPPVELTVNVEAGKEYEIVKNKEGQIKIYCKADDSYLGFVKELLYKTEDMPEGNACYLKQAGKVSIGDSEPDMRVMKFDSYYGNFCTLIGYKYVFNDPKDKNNVKLQFSPGPHSVELMVTGGVGAQKAEFTAEAGKTYEIKFVFVENTDKKTNDVVKGYVMPVVVEKE